MPAGEDRSRSRTLMAEPLERILERDVKDAGAAQDVERYGIAGSGRASTFAEQHGHDIASLLQEALDEGAPDKKLSNTVAALGLLLASLDSRPPK